MSNSRDCDTGDWTSFTGQPKPRPRLQDLPDTVAGKRILVTGAGGFIGTAVTKALATLGPAELILLDHGELGLHHLERDLPSHQPTRFVVGSVLDTDLLNEVFDHHRPQIVIHAAACKHVPLMEANPFAAASTNVLGTDAIVRIASASRAEQFLLLSTDKAVEPVSIMGATKHLAERVTLRSQPGSDTTRKVLRLGNVLGSSGSVVPLFLSQIAHGGPVTVTHPDITRYFLSIDDAVLHLLSALSPETPGGILVPEIGPPHRIQDLARFLIDQHAPANNSIGIAFTGLRPGDKLEERLLSSHETRTAFVQGGLQLIQPPGLSPHTLVQALEDICAAVKTRNLHLLLQALEAIVPEYRPSHLLRGSVPDRELDPA